MIVLTIWIYKINTPSVQASLQLWCQIEPQNRDYNRSEIKLSLGMNLFSPFESKKEFFFSKMINQWKLYSTNMCSTPAVWKQYNKMAVLYFFRLNSTLHTYLVYWLELTIWNMLIIIICIYYLIYITFIFTNGKNMSFLMYNTKNIYFS